MIYEFVPIQECYSQLAHKLNVPIILTMPIRAATYFDWTIGIPSSPAVVPNGFSYIPKTMNFYQRLENTVYHLYLRFLFYNDIESRSLKIRKKFGIPEFPDFNYSLVFQNSHPSLLPRPLSPSVIEIGGIHIQPAKPLPQVTLNHQEPVEQSLVNPTSTMLQICS